jgi:hypothetical protein
LICAGSALAAKISSRFCRSWAGVCGEVAVHGGPANPRNRSLGSDDGALAEAGGQIIRTDLMDLPTPQRICERGRELRIKAGTLSGVADGGEHITEHAAPRLLDDVQAVFTGDEARLWSETVVVRLAEVNPDAYDGWTPTDLATCLKPYGVATGQVWGQTVDGQGANRRGVTREDVLEALTQALDRPPRTRSRAARPTPLRGFAASGRQRAAHRNRGPSVPLSSSVRPALTCSRSGAQ